MRELNLGKQRPAVRNRFNKKRRTIDYRGFCKKIVRVVAVLVVLSLVGVVSFEMYGFLHRTTFLRLENIEVKGLKRIPREEILGQAAVKVGDDMLGMRLRRMGEQVGKNPWVAAVKVRRAFPHTLLIDLQEREPVAVVSMGYLYYLDSRGDIFKPLNEGDSLDYPVVTGFAEDELSRDPAGSKAALKGVLKLIGDMKGQTGFTLADVSEVHYDKGFGYTLFTVQGGVPIRLGNSGFAEKLERFAKVYQQLQGQMPHLEYVDLDYSDKIVVKKV